MKQALRNSMRLVVFNFEVLGEDLSELVSYSILALALALTLIKDETTAKRKATLV